MPIYEYKCGACGRRIEKLQKLSDPPCKKCPSCGGALTKLISSPAIQFKGNGFYITDYAKKNSPSEERKAKADREPAAPAKPEAKAEVKSEAKSEAKPEKKAESKSESKPAAKKPTE
ncbi:MAG: zinc ribbon domain-containing protein [Acidobacteriota bacterium]|nr:zinc ribbon domain-containing protein [Acidobacteriota bacterium]